MTEERTIKKYPNRRLYDMAISSYITLQDVKKLVVAGNSIKVVDAKTQNDLSSQTLLQIISEQEQNNCQLFSKESLEQLVRLYNSPHSAQAYSFINQCIEFFSEQVSMDMADADAQTLAKRNQDVWESAIETAKNTANSSGVNATSHAGTAQTSEETV